MIEDDPTIAAAVHGLLGDCGHDVRRVESGRGALRFLRESDPDLVILDLVLPDVDGLYLYLEIRERTTAPVIVCSATSRKRDALMALKLGVHDFIPKPFDADELEVRVERALRARREPYAPSSAPAVASTPPASLGALSVLAWSKPAGLTPTERRVLRALAVHADRVVPHAELAGLVWGPGAAPAPPAMAVYLHRLRAKLEMLDRSLEGGVEIIAVRGVGYKLVTGGVDA